MHFANEANKLLVASRVLNRYVEHIYCQCVEPTVTPLHVDFLFNQDANGCCPFTTTFRRISLSRNIVAHGLLGGEFSTISEGG